MRREDNVEVDKYAQIVLEEALDMEWGELQLRWKTWLEDPWYGELVEYLLSDRVFGVTPRCLRKICEDS